MRIGQLAKRLDLSVSTIKYYIRKGLVSPGERVDINQVEYSESHFDRLLMIKLLTTIGNYSLEEVATILEKLDNTAYLSETIATMELLHGSGEEFTFDESGDIDWARDLVKRHLGEMESRPAQAVAEEFSKTLATIPEDFSDVAEGYLARYLKAAEAIVDIDADLLVTLTRNLRQDDLPALVISIGLLIRKLGLGQLISLICLQRLQGVDIPFNFESD